MIGKIALVTGDFVGRAVAAGTGAGLLRNPRVTPVAAHGKIGGAHHAFEVFGATMGALGFHGIVALDRQEFKKFLTFQAAKFIYGH